VEQLGGQLLSPDSRFVELTTSKCDTTRHLGSAGVRVPPTFFCDDPSKDSIDLDPPLVVKPNDGAGSIGVQYLERAIDASTWLGGSKAICVQTYCPGRPASVSVLCGQHQSVLLPACWQHLHPPRFEYLGGSVIEDFAFAERAAQLARAVVNALPKTRGLIGVDLVLGDQVDGSADYVIEVNPRLTTSYIGLRCLSDQNLAQGMLSASNGDEIAMSFRPDRIEFSASGSVRRR
jgi:predicted ATP-grasp superfamily ATP-dependent carboligase